MREAFDMPVDEYKKLKRQGLSNKEIAKRLYVSTATLSRWMKREGVTANVHTVEEYIKLRDEGWRDHQIEVQWNMTPAGLYQWKVRHNIPKKYFGTLGIRGNNKEQKRSWGLGTPLVNITVEEYKKLKDIGLTDKEVSERLQISHKSLDRWKRNKGLIKSRNR